MASDCPQIALQQLTEHLASVLLAQNPLLRDKISRTLKLAPEQIQPGLLETVRFMWLCANHSQVLTPSARVDLIWHELILFTRSYATFCQQHLGTFVHHQPSDQPDVEQQQYRCTLERYRECFGQPDRYWWPTPDHSTHCGTCED